SLLLHFILLSLLLPPRSTLFPYTTLFRSLNGEEKSESFGLISYNLTDFHAKSRALYVSSGNDLIQANNMIDGQPTSAYTFGPSRSEEHTSELQSRVDLVCRLLLEKKKKKR